MPSKDDKLKIHVANEGGIGLGVIYVRKGCNGSPNAEVEVKFYSPKGRGKDVFITISAAMETTTIDGENFAFVSLTKTNELGT